MSDAASEDTERRLSMIFSAMLMLAEFPAAPSCDWPSACCGLPIGMVTTPDPCSAEADVACRNAATGCWDSDRLVWGCDWEGCEEEMRVERGSSILSALLMPWLDSLLEFVAGAMSLAILEVRPRLLGSSTGWLAPPVPMPSSTDCHPAPKLCMGSSGCCEGVGGTPPCVEESVPPSVPARGPALVRARAGGSPRGACGWGGARSMVTPVPCPPAEGPAPPPVPRGG